MALYFGSDPENLAIHHVSHAVDHFLRLLTEWIEHAILFRVYFYRFSIRTRFELMSQLLNCFLAGVILFLNGRMVQTLGS